MSDPLRPALPSFPDAQKNEAIAASIGRLPGETRSLLAYAGTRRCRPAPQDGWFARAAVSGFVAAFVMLAGFASAYGGALLLDRVLSNDGYGLATLRGWVHALTHNSVLNLGQANLYIAVATYFGGGLLSGHWSMDVSGRNPPLWRGLVARAALWARPRRGVPGCRHALTGRQHAWAGLGRRAAASARYATAARAVRGHARADLRSVRRRVDRRAEPGYDRESRAAGPRRASGSGPAWPAGCSG